MIIIFARFESWQSFGVVYDFTELLAVRNAYTAVLKDKVFTSVKDLSGAGLHVKIILIY
jgi:hypothetical protein